MQLLSEPINLSSLERVLRRTFELASEKITNLARRWEPKRGSPVFTRQGRYVTRGWTDWTQGFQFGCQILLFDVSGDKTFWEIGRKNTLEHMPAHVSHCGVHDHGFNIISTYGNLRRLVLEGLVQESEDFLNVCEMALKLSGAVQAMRWTQLPDGEGYIYSFNGPHSLFCDTIRSCRSLVLAHQLGHFLAGENDRHISLLERAVVHASTTSKYNVYWGKGRDVYDVPGRVAHESLFNIVDGKYRCPSTQQGYSPFSTWTRGLSWVILGFAELAESLPYLKEADLDSFGGQAEVRKWMVRTAQVAADYYMAHTPADGVPYWDTGAPGLALLGDWRAEPAQYDNPYEPVDSSAAAIAAQGFLRLANLLGPRKAGKRYFSAGISLAYTLFREPYLSMDRRHEGILLHSVYHRPKGWDYIPKGKSVPQGESSMWGDYHALELAVYLKRIIEKSPYMAFFDKNRS